MSKTQMKSKTKRLKRRPIITISLESDDDDGYELTQVKRKSSTSRSKKQTRHTDDNIICDCVLDVLRSTPFTSHPFADQLKIIETGRPTPALTRCKEKKGRGVYNFKPFWYDKFNWLCGCLTTQKMYCWPCVLFGTSRNAAWGDVANGVSDLTNFSLLKQRHIGSKEHALSTVELARFGKRSVNVEETLEVAEKQNRKAHKHNELVKSNRFVLTRLVDAICFFRDQEKELYEETEGNSAFDLRKYKDLFDSISKTDYVLEHHLSHSNINRLSYNIENELIQAVSEVVCEEIKKEIFLCKFVSLNLTEIVDVSGSSLVSTVVRYVSNHKVYEKFIKFEHVNAEHSDEALLESILNTVKALDCGRKLIGVTYDGLVSGKWQSRLQEEIRKVYSDALFIPSHMHNLSDILQQSLRSIHKCRAFFQTCSELTRLFNKSASHAEAFHYMVSQSMATSLSSTWNCHVISVLHSARADVETLLVDMTRCDLWDEDSRASAATCLSTLREADFQFLLALFSPLLFKAENLFHHLQSHLFDSRSCEQRMDDFIIELGDLRASLADDWVEDDDTKPLNKCPGGGFSKRQCLVDAILADVKTCLRTRYSGFKEWTFLMLLHADSFSSMRHEFPDNALVTLNCLYEEEFDFSALKWELQVLYADPIVRGQSLLHLNQYLQSSGIQEVLPQVYKLTELFLCLPLTRLESSVERLCLDQRHRLSRSQLNLLAIDKPCLDVLVRSSAFHDRVIDKFRVNKEWGEALEFK